MGNERYVLERAFFETSIYKCSSEALGICDIRLPGEHCQPFHTTLATSVPGASAFAVLSARSIDQHSAALADQLLVGLEPCS